MIFNIAITTEDTLLQIVDSIINGNFVQQGGLTVTKWTSGTTTVEKTWPVPAIRLLEEAYMALSLLNPTKYGTRVTRTRPNFYQWY